MYYMRPLFWLSPCSHLHYALKARPVSLHGMVVPSPVPVLSYFDDFGRMRLFCFKETRDPILITIRAWVFIVIYLLLVIQQGVYNIVLVHLFHHVSASRDAAYSFADRKLHGIHNCYVIWILLVHAIGEPIISNTTTNYLSSSSHIIMVQSNLLIDDVITNILLIY